MAAALKRGDARVYAQRYIISGVRSGLSGNQILQNLRSVSIDGQSLGYRTQTFYQDYNRYTETTNLPSKRTLPSLPKDFTANYSFKIPSTGGNRWNYVANVKGLNTTTGETESITFSFTSSVPLLDELIPSAFETAFSGMYSQIQYNINDVEFSNPRQFFSEVP